MHTVPTDAVVTVLAVLTTSALAMTELMAMLLGPTPIALAAPAQRKFFIYPHAHVLNLVRFTSC